MTKEGIQVFKELFRKYCREEINKENCESDYCEFCPISNAYDKIFSQLADNDKDEDF